MRNIWVLFSFQTKLLIINWRTLLLFLVIPIMLFASLILILEQLLEKEGVVAPFKMAIVDQDNTVETALVIKQLEDHEQLEKLVELLQTDEKTAHELIQANKVAGILKIPKGFSKDVRNGKNTPVSVIGNKNQPLQAALIRYLVESAANLTSAAQSGINTIYEFISSEEISKKELRAEYKKSIVSFSLHIIGRNSIYQQKHDHHLYLSNLKQYYCISFYILTLFIWGFGSVFLLKREVLTTVSYRLLSRGVLPVQKNMADLLALLVVLNSAAIVVGVAMDILLKLDIPFLLMALTSILIMTTFTSLFMMFYTFIGNLKIYLFFCIPILFISSIISGHFFPTSFLPKWLETISGYSVDTMALQHLFSLVGEKESILPLSLFFIMIVQFLLTIFFSTLREKRWEA